MEFVQDDRRFVIATGFIGDEMQMTWYPDGSLYIEIDEPWQGCTETGFGARCSVTLPATTARALAKWLERTSCARIERSELESNGNETRAE